MARANVQIYQGDDVTLRFQVLNPDGSIANISGATFRWALARHARSAVLITVTSPTITIFSLAEALVDVPISRTSTASLDGLYYHELEMTIAGVIRTVADGEVEILPTVLD